MADPTSQPPPPSRQTLQCFDQNPHIIQARDRFLFTRTSTAWCLAHDIDTITCWFSSVNITCQSQATFELQLQCNLIFFSPHSTSLSMTSPLPFNNVPISLNIIIKNIRHHHTCKALAILYKWDKWGTALHCGWLPSVGHAPHAV